ncbi:hybrid sensor histidine kinase/response regulator [Massilia sp. G4R7]|uniref:histidine kinase n=1 Tax=Massilia phyllostachyos TaxID=2898585 RepID=A0ABS8Q292_9BURK|nr:hybrid sensor histidine kinase/response regulator [Massilia phyllostachyos]MCD2515858.1 hybrid sensor histidine kinase/response regulator [Massilia phyllostachyos]
MSVQDPSKLLIVDDLPENLRALDALIRGEGRLVFQASSGEEALALMLQHEFALAICDVQMPGMDGFELAELMRGTERTRNIPIVFVSAAGRELNYAFKGYETGAVDFLYKPLDPDAVRSKVNVFVTLDQQRRQMQRQMAALERSRQEQETLLRELNQTQAELQRSLRMRDEFMSLVAHELRTPLNTLFLETQMRSLQLKRGTLASIDPTQFDAMIKRDERQIKAMIRLIDDMLDVSRMRSGQLSIRPGQVELMNLLERVISDLSLQANATGCKLSLQPHPPVQGCWDEFRIEQVVVNLLTNALRYGGGQPVEVSVQYADDQVRIHVRDEGKGIAVQDLERIFEPYERGARNGEPKGLGLGLYISRQLAVSHGGELRVTSKPGEGSTFTLILPTCEQTVAAATTA